MKVRFFRRGYRCGWEINLIGRVWNLRIAQHQVALWKHQRAVFNFLNAPEPAIQIGVPALAVLVLVALASCSPSEPTPPAVPSSSNTCTVTGSGTCNIGTGNGNVTNPPPSPSASPGGDNVVESFGISCYGFGAVPPQPEPNHQACALPPGYPNIAVTASPKNKAGVDIPNPGDKTSADIIDWRFSVSPVGAATLAIQADNRFNARVEPASPRVPANFTLVAIYKDPQGNIRTADKGGSIQ